MTKQEIYKLVDDIVGEKPEAVVEILDGLRMAAGETAEHLSSNWQDRSSAKAWEKISTKIEKVARDVESLLPF